MKIATLDTSTSCSAAKASNASASSGVVASVILSCDSLTRISQEDNPSCLSGTFAKSISQPFVYSAISPIDEDSPPAPLSVMQEINPMSLASRVMSSNFFCVIGSPI